MDNKEFTPLKNKEDKPKAAKKVSKKKVKPKQKGMTLKEAKQAVATNGLKVSEEYDKRFKNTWLYVLGQDVEPVLRNKIVHQPKPEKKKLSWAALQMAAIETK